MQPEVGDPLCRPLNRKYNYLILYIRYQLNFNGYIYVFEVDHSNGIGRNTVTCNWKSELKYGSWYTGSTPISACRLHIKAVSWLHLMSATGEVVH
jgi:hypothetical protein